ncbi:MAG: tetratricopeptide repeat protein [Anaerolineales bacterium]|nr:tetratricopeptide repeat protein [Anaerolineales bacterium]
MSETALRNYLFNIDQIIEQKHYDEAVAHCKHVLSHYPKNLEAYRLLAKALLEKGRHGDAADIFQRVLSVAPDDFLAHVGMAIVREDEANLSAALWHMERAFEANSANPAIQEELKRLYGRRDGMPPARARLTRGALARMYLRGELYPQAEAELRSALMEDPERLDLTAMLARVLLETGRRAEAADMCNAVLQKLPYNQEANRVLAEILKHQGRENEAKPHQQRLEALDPYEAYAEGEDAHNVKAEAVTLPELILDQEGQAIARKPEWAEALGEEIGTAGGVFSSEEPEWLREGTDSLLSGQLPVTGELPDAGEVPDWLKNVEPLETTPAAAADLPDWMKATTGMLADRPPEAGAPIKKGTGKLTGWLSSPGAVGPLGTASGGGGDDIPDWMKDLQPPKPENVPTVAFGDYTPTNVLPNDEMPTMALDNNTAMFGDQPTSVLPVSGGLPPSGGFQEDLPDWLKPAEPAQPMADLPDWLKATTEETSNTISSAMLTGGPQEDSFPTAAFANMTPEWLKTMAAEGEAAAPVAGQDEDLPDWLKNATGKLTPDSAPVAPAAADDLPPWLQGTGNAPAAEPTEAVPDWLNVSTGSLDKAAPAEELPPWLQGTGNLEAAQPAGDVPDWLKVGAGSLSESAPAVPVGETPPWLKVETGPLAEAAEAQTPAAESDEIPAWLKNAGETGLLGGAALAGVAAAGALSVEPEPEAPKTTFPAEIELPDFLQPASAEAIARAETPVDWDDEVAPAETEAVADEMPDWIKAMAPPAQPEVSLAEDEVAKVAEDELPDWLQAPTKPTGDLPDVLPADDLPLPPAGDPTLSANKPGSSETIRTWLSDKDVPDWLRQARAETEVPEAPALPEPEALAAPDEALPEFPDWLKAMQTDPGSEGPIQPVAEMTPDAEPAMPDFANMSEDEQMRWLETLAARQGADPAELITQPNVPETAAGPLMPPTGILPDEESAAQTVDDMPDWLKAMQTDYEAQETPMAEETPAPVMAEELAAEPVSEMPDFASMSEDEQMRWLESLAARQGADPAELITQPSTPETLAGPVMPSTGILPEWAEEPAPTAEPVSEMPDFARFIGDEPEIPPTGPLMPRTGILPPLPEEFAPDVSAAPVSAVPDFASMSEDEQMRWLESLAARQGADPAELITQPEERFELPSVETEIPPTGPLMPRTGILPPLPEELAPDAAAEPVNAVPDFSSMTEDEQMRWLESLAARQGADPAELITQPEERFELPPMETPAPSTGPIMPATGVLPSFEEELSTPLAPLTPEELRTDVPAWLSGAAEPAEPPDWLKAIQIASAPRTEVAEESAPPPSEPVLDAEVPAEPVSAVPDFASMSEDEQMRWLESLAARQGADPAELITPAEERPIVPEMPAEALAEEPEPEPLAGPPDWVKATPEEVSAPVFDEPATPAEEEIPAWIRAATNTGLLRTPPPEPTPAPKPEPVQPPPPKPEPAKVEPAKAEGGDDRLSRLAETLQAKRRQRDEEVAARLEKERSDREAAMRAVEESMEARRTRRTESDTGSLSKGGTGMLRKPGTGPLPALESTPTSEPAVESEPTPAPRAESKRPAPVVEEEDERPRSARRRQEPIRLPAGTRLKRSRKSKPKKAKFAGQNAREVLGQARQLLNQRDYTPAVEQFEYLIRSGDNLKEVVAELESFVNANENAGVFFRVLGDAYMRSGQLQPALDAYRQALTQM